MSANTSTHSLFAHPLMGNQSDTTGVGGSQKYLSFINLIMLKIGHCGKKNSQKTSKTCKKCLLK